MSRSFLIVLPKEMRSAVAPAASTSSISTTEAASKHEPSCARRLQHLRRRVGLHGVEHARVRQGAGELRVVVLHDVEVDDDAGPVLVASVAQELADALGHGALPTRFNRRALQPPVDSSGGEPPGSAGKSHRAGRALETRAASMGSSPEKLPLFGRGAPQPHAGQDGQASSVSTFGGPTRPKKPVPSLL